jgi:hypothetical protein
MIRETSATWTSWGMPPRADEGERPPVPKAATWYVVDVDAAPDVPPLRPDAPPDRWYWTRRDGGHSVSFRCLGVVEAYEARTASAR